MELLQPRHMCRFGISRPITFSDLTHQVAGNFTRDTQAQIRKCCQTDFLIIVCVVYRCSLHLFTFIDCIQSHGILDQQECLTLQKKTWMRCKVCICAAAWITAPMLTFFKDFTCITELKCVSYLLYLNHKKHFKIIIASDQAYVHFATMCGH